MSALSRLWSLRRDRPLLVAASILTLVALVSYPAVEAFVRSIGLAQPVNYQDFGVYRAAVDRWLAGDPIYVTNDDGYWGTYLYPPVVLPLFWPFTYPTHAQAGLAWGLLSVALLWLALQLVVARLGCELRWWERLLGLWALAGFHPLMLSFKLGQTAGFLGALLAFALAAMLADDRAQSYLSGALTAFVGVFKMAYAPVGAHLLADRKRFLGAAVAGVGLVAASIAVFGLGANRAYLDVLAWGVAHGSGDRLPTAGAWLPAYFRQLHWLPGSLFVRLGIAAAVSLAAVLSQGADRALFALGVGTFLLITPLPYVYYFVAALPAVLALLAVELDRDGVPTVPVVVLLLLHVHSYVLRLLAGALPTLLGGLPDPVYPLLQPGLWGVLLLFGLAGYRVCQEVVVPEAVGSALPSDSGP